MAFSGPRIFVGAWLLADRILTVVGAELFGNPMRLGGSWLCIVPDATSSLDTTSQPCCVGNSTSHIALWRQPWKEQRYESTSSVYSRSPPVIETARRRLDWSRYRLQLSAVEGLGIEDMHLEAFGGIFSNDSQSDAPGMKNYHILIPTICFVPLLMNQDAWGLQVCNARVSWPLRLNPAEKVDKHPETFIAPIVAKSTRRCREFNDMMKDVCSRLPTGHTVGRDARSFRGWNS